MVCKYCGQELEENARFCSTCGKLVAHEAEETAPPQEESRELVAVAAAAAPQEDAERDARGKSILTYAIIGLAFANTFYFAFIGIIFSAIARTKLKQYLALYTETQGTATVGKYLSLAGLITSIVLTGILGFVLIVLIGTLFIELMLY